MPLFLCLEYNTVFLPPSQYTGTQFYPHVKAKLSSLRCSLITQLKLFSPSHDTQGLSLTIQGIMLIVLFLKSLCVCIVTFQLDVKLPQGENNVVWTVIGAKTLSVGFSRRIMTGKGQRHVKGHDYVPFCYHCQ